jgi:hypothetical protein
MAAKAMLRLPPVPDRKGYNAWEDLRNELRRFNLVMTIFGLGPDGRPTIKLVGTKVALRNWLDQAGYECVYVDGDREPAPPKPQPKKRPGGLSDYKLFTK